MGAMQAWAKLVTAALAIAAATTIATTISALICLRGTVHNNAIPAFRADHWQAKVNLALLFTALR